MTKTTRKKPRPDVPPLPRASEIRETVVGIERGLKHLRGLAIALGRVEAAAGVRDRAGASNRGDGARA